MKKLMILLAVTCLIFASCCNKTKPAVEVAEETCCTLTPEQQEMFDNWEMWADLDEEQQIVLVADMKAFMDECKAKCAEKCKAKEESEEAEEVCPHKKAKCEEFKAKWEAFETLTLEEQKCMLDCVLKHMCNKDKEEKGCCKDKEKEGCEKKCDKEKEGCEKKCGQE
jgi:hypothetical protein